ncbi:MAG: RecQ family ATP-dependent DNA helicase [Chitinophagaceae bacterium]|nr:RecQ family ATP-dependent DNA helicase [Chitinophagaceae bacterium]
MPDSPKKILAQYWGYDSFRPMQEEIILSVLSGRDTMALLPTGGGKSICFQVPGLILEGVCLVISPLIALMKDQTENLQKKDIAVASIHSGLSYYEVNTILKNAAEGHYKFLYLSPERLETKAFKEYLPHLDISLIVVDEAHCVSQWGYDFRPPYLRIANIRAHLDNVPMIALTASATKDVQNDIVAKLELKNVAIFKQSFEKPNLSYSVFKVDSKVNKLIAILESVPGSSIIYCNNRRQCKDLSELLQLQNISADFYHAGLSSEERTARQESWINNKTRVIACTNAFGLGIDKPDVRTVIHYDAPECLENYYQEAGRAGRDLKKSYAVLLYQQADIEALETMPDKRYPPIPIIKKIYQCVADFLQLPVGAGEAQYFDFDLSEFVKNFKLDLYQVTNVLKILEQEGHCMLSENIFLPAKIQFTTNKDSLYLFEENYPDLEEMIKTLLRTYEGIFDNKVSIFEKQISRILREPLDEVVQKLQNLHRFGIIEYAPQKETPQIYFVLNRAPAEYLHIDQDLYLKRKKLYQNRLDAFIHFVQLRKACRSNAISNYFGEKNVAACGICDNCLDAKKKTLSADRFSEIEKSIMQLIAKGISVNELIKESPQFSVEELQKVLAFMESENRIAIAETGEIRLC